MGAAGLIEFSRGIARLDKAEVVRCLRLANQLWAIEGANPYSVKAHDKAAEAIAKSPLSIPEILRLTPGQIPGVGKETLAMLQTFQTHGMPGLLQRLQISIPLHSVELLRLPGIGPKTAHHLIRDLKITSLADLRDALQAGRLQHGPGLGASRMARLRRDLRVILDRKQTTPIAVAWPVAIQLAEVIARLPHVESATITGSARRLLTMPSAVELVVVTNEKDVVQQWASQFQQANACTAATQDHASHRSTTSFVLHTDTDDIHVTLHFASATNHPLVLMRTTGDETHQAVITGLLHQRGLLWTDDDRLISDDEDSNVTGKSSRTDANDSNLTRTKEIHSPTARPVRDEEDIYELVGLRYLPPEVREGEGLLCNVDELVKHSDIRGDLHVHTNWSDGSLSIEEVVQHAEKLGYEYVAITDHSESLTIAGGLTPDRVREQRAVIEHIRPQTKVHILHGIEVDILSNGDLDLPDDVLFDLDVVIASVHSSMQQTKDVMTERLLRAIRHPAVHIIGHLTGRILGRRAGYEVDADTLLQAASNAGVTFELNANPNRLDISEELLRKAKTFGFLIPINTDTHHEQEFAYMDYGVRMARRGWLQRADVLNTLPYKQLVRRLQKPLRRRT